MRRPADFVPQAAQSAVARLSQIVAYPTRYRVVTYVFFFFTFSFVGWLWEVGFALVQTGQLVNRGLLIGPWLPIYGTGGVLLLLLMKPFYKRPMLTFFLSMTVCTVLEYFTSLVLELMFHRRWWDYSSYALNLHGRVCLEGALIFGLGCCAIIYLVAPRLGRLYDRIPHPAALCLCAALVGTFGFDCYHSIRNPNAGEGITGSVVSVAVASVQSRLFD